MVSATALTRRNGTQQACEHCRKAKIRCDHSTPQCGRCTRRKIKCVYHPAPMTRAHGGGPSQSRVRSPTAASTQIGNEHSTPQVAPILDVVESQLQRSPHSVAATPSTSTSQSSSGKTALFRKPHAPYGTTQFSAMFLETQASLGKSLLDVTGEDEELYTKESSRADDERPDFDDPAFQARMDLGVKTLKKFPTQVLCECLLNTPRVVNDNWLATFPTWRLLENVWAHYGTSLRSRKVDKLSQVVLDLDQNGRKPFHLNEAPENFFGGPDLRWEMIGLLFTYFGFCVMHAQEFDPMFDLPEFQGMDRKSGAERMRGCAEVCLKLYGDAEPNDMYLVLAKDNWKLQSIIAGDESHYNAQGAGIVLSLALRIGLHRLSPIDNPTPLSEYRNSLFASLYCLEKRHSLFNATPLHLGRRYCRWSLPLDLNEEELFGSLEDFNAAKAKLDENGWKTDGSINCSTWVRALCLQTPIHEQMIEWALGVNESFSCGQVDDQIRSLDRVAASFPSQLQYQNIHHWTRRPGHNNSGYEYYTVTRIHLDVLQSRFLLERLKVSRGYANGQSLLDVSRETLAVVLSIWTNRDWLQLYNYSFDWILVCYGIPAAGVLGVELLKSSKPATPRLHYSRSEVIQALTMFCGFLDWIRPTDGNYLLCRKLRAVIRRILDVVLDAPAAAPAPQQQPEALASSQMDVRTPGAAVVGGGAMAAGDATWDVFDESDCLDWLTTIDWTQAGNLEFT